MAPEVLTSSATRRYDGKAADVWALGVMLYTLVAGTYPFADYADMLNKDKVFEVCVGVRYGGVKGVSARD
jgi:serine/threonine protein kinase